MVGELDLKYATDTQKGSYLRRAAPSQGQPKWWRAGQGAVPPREERPKNFDIAKEKTKDDALPPDRPKWRRAGARACQKCRIRRRLKTRPRTNLNGGDLVRSTFLIITFPFTLAFMATFVLALILAFVAPFGGRIFTFLGCNGEKRSILSWGGGNTFGAFGWALACARGGWSLPAYTVRGGIVEEDGSTAGVDGSDRD